MALKTIYFPYDMLGLQHKSELSTLTQEVNWTFHYGDPLSGYIGSAPFDDFSSDPTAHNESNFLPPLLYEAPQADVACIKRRKPRARKNKEELETQRMTHIAVERNRRRQMNDYLAVLRSLMPEYCITRGDQASIIGGAINFVKELEQQLQHYTTEASSIPFSEFFHYPQFSTVNSQSTGAVADIEVTMADCYANVKIRARKKPKQLLKIVTGLQFICLTILHLNVTSKNDYVFCSVSVQAQEECRFTSVDEIALAVHQIMSNPCGESAII